MSSTIHEEFMDHTQGPNNTLTEAQPGTPAPQNPGSVVAIVVPCVLAVLLIFGIVGIVVFIRYRKRNRNSDDDVDYSVLRRKGQGHPSITVETTEDDQESENANSQLRLESEYVDVNRMTLVGFFKRWTNRKKTPRKSSQTRTPVKLLIQKFERASDPKTTIEENDPETYIQEQKNTTVSDGSDPIVLRNWKPKYPPIPKQNSPKPPIKTSTPAEIKSDLKVPVSPKGKGQTTDAMVSAVGRDGQGEYLSVDIVGKPFIQHSKSDTCLTQAGQECQGESDDYSYIHVKNYVNGGMVLKLKGELDSTQTEGVRQDTLKGYIDMSGNPVGHKKRLKSKRSTDTDAYDYAYAPAANMGPRRHSASEIDQDFHYYMSIKA